MVEFWTALKAGIKAAPMVNWLIRGGVWIYQTVHGQSEIKKAEETDDTSGIENLPRPRD